MTQIIETFFYEHGSELLFFEYDPRNWFFTMTLRIAPFFHITLKTVLKMTQRNKNFFFFEYDSKNWTLFENMTQRIERFFGKYAFENITHRIELFLKKDDSQNCTLLFNMTQRNWTHFLRKEYFYFFKIYDSNKLILFGKHDSKNWTLFEYDSKNWTLFRKRSHRIETLLWTFFSIWLTEMHFFFQYDSKNWFFYNDSKNSIFEKKSWRKELKIFLEYDAKNSTFFMNMTQRIQLFSWIWRKELNLFFLTQRILPIFERDSKNATFFK